MRLQMVLDVLGKLEVYAAPITVEPVDITVTDNAVLIGRPGVTDGEHEVGYLATFLQERMPFDPEVVQSVRALTSSPATPIDWEALSYVIAVDGIAPKVEIVFRKAS